MPLPLRLRKNLARRIREGHPWIYRDAIEPPAEAPPEGAVVELRSPADRVLATGFWDSSSAIAVRILEAGPVADVERLVRDRVDAALRLRLARLDPARTDAFRWIHGEGDRLPGIHLDLYAGVAVAKFDGGGARAFYRGFPGLFGERTFVDRELERGPLVVARENGLEFEVATGKGGKGGLFLDQRENREEVERLARGKSVLNLFGYTGGFSMYAARGGATSTDTVDVAAPAVAAARRNFGRNALPMERAGFHVADCWAWLEAAAAKRRTWELVITDPPSFAPNKSSLAAARGAYGKLHRLAAAVTRRGGTLCAASCSSHVSRADFVATLRNLRVLEVRGAGFDHPSLPSFPEGDYLKFAIARNP